MTRLPPIRRALVSVSDKAGLAELAEILVRHRVEVLSTGGTFAALEAEGVAVVRLSDYTGAPEILDGRVKTLHPRVHGGILARPTPAHEEELELNGIAPIDLVVVNLYPFRETIARRGCDFQDAIENIDVGGPTMVRAAAKNWERVTVIVDPTDYAELGRALRAGEGRVPEPFRRRMSRKAFAHTAAYDAAIAAYLARFDDQGAPLPGDAVPPALFLTGEPLFDLRYGENPHQPARFFRADVGEPGPTGLDRAVRLQGKDPSYNNLLDADAALCLVRELAPLGRAAAVIKHLTPCGVAVGRGDESPEAVYRRAREADAESAFGGIVGLTDPVDEALAAALAETFLELVIAPGFSAGARERLGQKANLRLFELASLLEGRGVPTPLRIRSVAGGVLVQREDAVSVAAARGRVVTRRAPAPDELAALDLAQRVAAHVRSNAIVLVADGVTVGIGGGQTSRVEAVRQALARAGDAAKGAALASDAFFPFRDGIDAAAAAGVCAVIQPGGSVRDAEVVDAADEHGVAMVFTGERHFRH
jgi:phosphoribosylaminoimidazolecarboxamide formyltransferase/IMP cyclohydrolase